MGHCVNNGLSERYAFAGGEEKRPRFAGATFFGLAAYLVQTTVRGQYESTLN